MPDNYLFLYQVLVKLTLSFPINRLVLAHLILSPIILFNMLIAKGSVTPQMQIKFMMKYFKLICQITIDFGFINQTNIDGFWA